MLKLVPILIGIVIVVAIGVAVWQSNAGPKVTEADTAGKASFTTSNMAPITDFTVQCQRGREPEYDKSKISFPMEVDRATFGVSFEPLAPRDCTTKDGKQGMQRLWKVKVSEKVTYAAGGSRPEERTSDRSVLACECTVCAPGETRDKSGECQCDPKEMARLHPCPPGQICAGDPCGYRYR